MTGLSSSTVEISQLKIRGLTNKGVEFVSGPVIQAPQLMLVLETE